MSHYYLMAQLPSLDALSESMPLPITRERFLELCERLVGKKMWDVIKNVTLIPKKDTEKTGYGLLDKWIEAEINLRLCLEELRKTKRKKNADVSQNIPSYADDASKVSKAAIAMTDPLEAERTLLKYRLEMLENLRPDDSFCDDAVFYYLLKLLLLARIRGFDVQKGRDSYKKIYGSIMDGPSLEAK